MANSISKHSSTYSITWEKDILELNTMTLKIPTQLLKKK